MSASITKIWRRRVLRTWHRRSALGAVERFRAQPRTLDEQLEFALALPFKGDYRTRTQQLPGEFRQLADAVTALRPKTILEIGTANGGTAFLWAQLASERIVTCDIRPDLAVRRPLIEAFGKGRCHVAVVHGDSHSDETFSRVAAALGANAVDFLFIDGDHSEAGVAEDYARYAPLVRPGGLVALHDIEALQPDSNTAVHRFWQRIAASSEATRELVERRGQCGYGIGLVTAGQSGLAASPPR